MSGTGRRRKPPVGGESDPQQQRPAYEGEQHQEYSTYGQAPEQYDYDLRRPASPQGPSAPAGPSAPGFPEQPRSFDAFAPGAVPAQPAAPAAEAWPPQYQQPYQEYQTPAPAWERRPAAPASAEPYEPYDARISRPAPPAQAPAPPPAAQPAAPGAPGPAGAEPDSSFEFDFDPDFAGGDDGEGDDGGEDGSASEAKPRTVAPRRPVDKDGYRPHDFDFVEESDNPEVKGWLSFTESRADSRAERLRRTRARLIVGVIVLALVGAGFGAYSWLSGGSSASPASAATKSLVFFELDDSSGDAVDDALLVTKRGGAADGSQAGGTGAVLVIPSQMQINTSFGGQPFGGDMTAQPQAPPADDSEIQDTFGVTPDGDMIIDETTFGLLIEELGGITLTTNTAVPATPADPSGVPLGSNQLSGVQAVAYATYTAKGEAPNAQAVRFAQVLSALLDVMPSEANEVTSYLNQVGLLARPPLTIAALSPILAALAAQKASHAVSVTTLPLSTDGSGQLNYAAAGPLVTKYLDGTMKAGTSAGQAVRVLVEDGTGADGGTDQSVIGAAQAKLENAGLTYNGGGKVATAAHSVVEVGSSSGQAEAEGIAADLGLSGSSVQVVPGLSTVDDVTVVLGADWPGLAAQ